VLGGVQVLLLKEETPRSLLPCDKNFDVPVGAWRHRHLKFPFIPAKLSGSTLPVGKWLAYEWTKVIAEIRVWSELERA